MLSERYEHEQKIKQYENTLQILKEEIEREKGEKMKIKTNL